MKSPMRTRKTFQLHVSHQLVFLRFHENNNTMVKTTTTSARVPKKLKQATITKAGKFAKPWTKEKDKENRRRCKGKTVARKSPSTNVDILRFARKDKNEASFDNIDNQESVIKFGLPTSPTIESISSHEDCKYSKDKQTLLTATL